MSQQPNNIKTTQEIYNILTLDPSKCEPRRFQGWTDGYGRDIEHLERRNSRNNGTEPRLQTSSVTPTLTGTGTRRERMWTARSFYMFFVWITAQLAVSVTESENRQRMLSAMDTQSKVDAIMEQFGVMFKDVVSTTEPIRIALQIPMHYAEVNNQLYSLNQAQMSALFQKEMVGVDGVLNRLVVMLRNFMDTINPPKPTFVLMSGVAAGGKTYMARLISKLLGLTDTVLFIEIPGASLNSPASVSLLIGPAPGLEGAEVRCYAQKIADAKEYQQAAIKAGKRPPKIVILIDELQFVHPKCLHIIRQLVDDGTIDNPRGNPQMVNVKDVLVIATANYGMEAIEQSTMHGETLSWEMALQMIRTAMMKSSKMTSADLSRFQYIIPILPIDREHHPAAVEKLVQRAIVEFNSSRSVLIQCTLTDMKHIGDYVLPYFQQSSAAMRTTGTKIKHLLENVMSNISIQHVKEVINHHTGTSNRVMQVRLSSRVMDVNGVASLVLEAECIIPRISRSMPSLSLTLNKADLYATYNTPMLTSCDSNDGSTWGNISSSSAPTTSLVNASSRLTTDKMDYNVTLERSIESRMIENGAYIANPPASSTLVLQHQPCVTSAAASPQQQQHMRNQYNQSNR